MKKSAMENQIKEAFSHAVPDVLDSVLDSCKEQKGKVIVMTQQKNSKSVWIKRISGIAAALVIVVAGITGFGIYQNNYAIDSTVSLDVNPSIEITVNQKERVLAVNALNEDAQKVLANMDFKGSNLDVTVNALIGSMLRNGYITELSNSILISVNNDDLQKGAALQERLTQEINALLQTESFSGAVLSQTLTDNTELQTLADTYGITLGKAQLIQQIVNQNPLYTFEGLVSLSINELNLLAASANTDLENIDSLGTASDKDYIGEEKAKEIALEHAGVAASAARQLQAKLDYEDGVMVYEVEFYAGNNEYDYEINAKTGAIIKSDKDYDDDAVQSNTGSANATTGNTQNNSNNNANSNNSAGNNHNSAATTARQPSASSYIGEAKAKEIALSHAGVSESSVRNYRVDLDTDDGVAVYDIDFDSGNYEYDYEINAKTGSVIKSERDRDDDANSNGSVVATTRKTSAATTAATASDIGEAKAKEIAFEHAGVQSSNVRELEVERDRDNGVSLYEISFKSGGYEYEYEINAKTGSILQHERERDD